MPVFTRTLGVTLAAVVALTACGGDASTAVTPPAGTTPTTAVSMTVLGRGDFTPQRRTAELTVLGTTAYTTTWGNSSAAASVFYVWDVSPSVPHLVDSVRVDSATTLGDIAVSDDGTLLVVATESTPGGILIYSLADPRKPVRVARYITGNTFNGVHTAEIGRVNGKLYGFLSIDPRSGQAARLVIADLSTPSAPVEVFTQVIGTPYVHDTFVRDGLLFVALWNAGVAIWDIGGGGKGGTPAAPVELGRVQTVNGEVHNVWWFKDPTTSTAKYAFIGEEAFGQVGLSSSGDIHVVDVSNMAAPREVAFYTVAGAGTHNFSVDEPNGILYAAYYNGGVRALDVRGDLGTCSAAQQSRPAGSSVPLCDLAKMGRELAVGLLDRPSSVYVWGVLWTGRAVYASDMIGGLWKLKPVARP